MLTGAGDRCDRFRFQIDCPNQMILCVRDKQRIAVKSHPLRPEERRVIERTIVPVEVRRRAGVLLPPTRPLRSTSRIPAQ